MTVAKYHQDISGEDWNRLMASMMQLAKGNTLEEHLPPMLEPATWVLSDICRRFKDMVGTSQNARDMWGPRLLAVLKATFRGSAGGNDGSMITPDELLARMQAITEWTKKMEGPQAEDYLYQLHRGFMSKASVFDGGMFDAAPQPPTFSPPRAPVTVAKPPMRARSLEVVPSHPALQSAPSAPATAKPPVSQPFITELERALQTLARAQQTLSTTALLDELPLQYIETCRPALVFEATGALRWSLEPIARTILTSLVGVRFFCVDALDWAAVPGGNCPGPDVVESYFNLPKPYIVLLERSEAEKAVAKGRPILGSKLEFGAEPYVPILAALDPPLAPKTADLLASMNEVVTAGMGHRISSSTTSVGRKDERVAPAEEYGPLYPDRQPCGQAEKLSGMLPRTPGMYSAMFRYSSQGNTIGARMVKGELQDQQAACAVALVDRESQEIIMPYMRPAVALLAGRAAPAGIGLTVGGLAVGCKLVTLGGWGNQVHTDDTDAGGQAFIIMYARGDLGRIRGGWFLLPGCHLRTTPGCPTLYYVASSLILHNTVPHTAGDYARIVGTSLHMNRNLKTHFAEAVTAPEGNGATEGAKAMFQYGHEKHISQETKDRYPVIRETLKKVVKKKTVRHADRWE